MGGNQSSKTRKNRLQDANWQRQVTPNGKQVYLNPQHPALVLEKYPINIDNQNQFHQLSEMYELRKNDPELIASHHMNVHVNEQLCSKSYDGELYLERMPLTLEDVTDIPFPDILHLHSQCLNGFQRLSRRYGNFPVYEDCIGVNTHNVIKVWHSHQYNKVLPTNTAFSEQQMVGSILQIVEQNTDHRTLPNQEPSIASFIYRESNNVGFSQAKRRLEQYANLFNRGILPNSLDCAQRVGGVERIKTNWVSEASKQSPILNKDQLFHESPVVEQKQLTQFQQPKAFELHRIPPSEAYPQPYRNLEPINQISQINEPKLKVQSNIQHNFDANMNTKLQEQDRIIEKEVIQEHIHPKKNQVVFGVPAPQTQTKVQMQVRPSQQVVKQVRKVPQIKAKNTKINFPPPKIESKKPTVVINTKAVNQNRNERIMNGKVMNVNQKMMNEKPINQTTTNVATINIRPTIEKSISQTVINNQTTIHGKFANKRQVNFNERPPVNERKVIQKPMNERKIIQKAINERKVVEKPQLISERPNEKKLSSGVITETIVHEKKIDEKMMNGKIINKKPITQVLINDKPVNSKAVKRKSNEVPTNKRTLTENMIQYTNSQNPSQNNISSTPSISIQPNKRPQTQVVFSNQEQNQNLPKKSSSSKMQIKQQERIILNGMSQNSQLPPPSAIEKSQNITRKQNSEKEPETVEKVTTISKKTIEEHVFTSNQEVYIPKKEEFCSKQNIIEKRLTLDPSDQSPLRSQTDSPHMAAKSRSGQSNNGQREEEGANSSMSSLGISNVPNRTNKELSDKMFSEIKEESIHNTTRNFYNKLMNQDESNMTENLADFEYRKQVQLVSQKVGFNQARNVNIFEVEKEGVGFSFGNNEQITSPKLLQKLKQTEISKYTTNYQANLYSQSQSPKESLPTSSEEVFAQPGSYKVEYQYTVQEAYTPSYQYDYKVQAKEEKEQNYDYKYSNNYEYKRETYGQSAPVTDLENLEMKYSVMEETYNVAWDPEILADIQANVHQKY